MFQAIQHYFGLLCLVPAIYGIRHFSKLNSSLKAFTLLMVFCSLCEFISIYLIKSHQNNQVLDHVYIPVEIAAITYAYSRYLIEFVSRRTLWLVAIMLILFSILNPVFFQNLLTSPGYSKGLACLFMMTLIMVYFYSLTKSDSLISIFQIPEVWVSICLLLYLSLSFFFYASGPLWILLPEDLRYLLYYIRAYSMLVFYLSISFAIWIHLKHTT